MIKRVEKGKSRSYTGGHCNNSWNGDSKIKEDPQLEGTWP